MYAPYTPFVQVSGLNRALPPKIAWLNIPPIKEGPIVDLELINTNGYSESKWVCERILTIAEQETSLRPVIVRVGQLSGGANGNWNAKEWFSGLVRASQIIGAAPENDGVSYSQAKATYFIFCNGNLCCCFSLSKRSCHLCLSTSLPLLFLNCAMPLFKWPIWFTPGHHHGRTL